MHMADALISPPVGGALLLAAAATVGVAVRRVRQNYQEEAVPLMAVMGAFIFAAQMVNFVIPGTGSSGHVTGAVLLAALLGPYAAFLALSCVIILQALFFADGGLLALGCNIFNMAFMGCFVAYPLFFKPLLTKGNTKPRLITAAVVTCIVAAQLGALAVVLQTLVASLTELPFGVFAALMQPIHLAIGAIEGVLTALVLLVIWRAEPGLLALNSNARKVETKTLIVFLCVATLILGGGLSLLASQKPDGLEWSLERAADTPELTADGRVYDAAAALQAQSALLPDYALPKAPNKLLGTSVAGLAGAVITVIVLFGLGLFIRKRRQYAETK